MIKTFAHLFTPRSSNNYKAKTLHLSSLSVFMAIIMFSQLTMTFISRSIPGVLGVSSNVTADDLISLTNEKRKENGLPELTVNSDLAEAATRKGADMIAKNYWSHTSPEGKTPWSFIQSVDYKYLYAGENLARDFIDSGSIVEAWLNSPTHRENLLSSRYREIGIAVINDTFQGQPTTLVVQMFGTQVGSAIPFVNAQNQPTESQEAVLAEITSPQPMFRFSSFTLTKAMSISLTAILLGVIVVDTIVITKKKIVRLSGNGFAHLIFLSVLLVILLGIQPGLVI